MNYDQMAAIGACGPVGCAPYPGVYPGAYGAYPYPAPFLGGFGGDMIRTDIIGRDPAVVQQAQPQVGAHLQHWDIVGQEPAAEGGWLQQPGPLGVTRLWWLLGATAIGATWFAYSRGMLGGSRRDFDGIGGDFFF